MNKKMDLILFILFLRILSVTAQEIQISNFPGNLIGVWPDTDNLKGAIEREFSWGTGLFPLHGAVVIDLDPQGNLYIENPGLGRYFITSIKYLSEDLIEFQMKMDNKLPIRGVPEEGSIIIKVISEKEIEINDSGYANMFGTPKEWIYKRLSPP